MIRLTSLGLMALLALGCAGAPAPSTIVIYVTPSPGASPAFTPNDAPTRTAVPPEPTPTHAARTPGPATPTPAARADIEVVEYGFSVNDGTASYAVILRNPNASTWAATYFSVQITLSNDAGPVVTETEYVTNSLPGIENAVAGYSSDVAGHPDRMEVRLGRIDWQEIDFTPGRFEFTNVTTSNDQFGYTTKGTATSHFELREESAELVAVYRDAAGSIIGGDSTYIDFIDPGQSVAFEVYSLSSVTDVDSVDMYWAW